MNKVSIILAILFFLGLPYSEVSAFMVPDEELLQDPKFVAEYGCSIEHFLIKKHFEKNEWNQAMTIIEHLEKAGYADRFLTVTKSKILMKQGKLNRSLEKLYQALNEDYKCALTAPTPLLKFAENNFNLADDAVIWHYISQLYQLMGNSKQAYITQAKSEHLLKQSLPIEHLNEKTINEIIKKTFIMFSLFQNPVTPLAP